MYWARHLVKILKAVDLIGRREGASIDELAQHLEANKRLVLSFGADAEVLEPEDLRKEIAADLGNMTVAYSRNK